MQRDDERESAPEGIGGDAGQRAPGETPASHGDPSRTGALGSDTGKVEVTGSEDEDGGQLGPGTPGRS